MALRMLGHEEGPRGRAWRRYNGYFKLADSAGRIPLLGATSDLSSGGRAGQNTIMCCRAERKEDAFEGEKRWSLCPHHQTEAADDRCG